jgi:polysaccharide pyruvyl transferase WcaK-like protein
MQHIRARWPKAVICGFSMNPNDTSARHRIPAYAIRQDTWDYDISGANTHHALKANVKLTLKKYPFIYRFSKFLNAVGVRFPAIVFNELRLLLKSISVLQSLDLLIINGGGQLLDSSGGPWAFPYTLYKWTILARVLNVRCYFLNVGAGPIRARLSNYFIQTALSLAHYVSVRDNGSRALLQSLGYKGPCSVVTDSVYGLEFQAVHDSQSDCGTRPLVGLSPMAYCDPRVYWQKDQQIYGHFSQQCAEFGAQISQKGYRLAVFSTDIYFDRQTVAEVGSAIRSLAPLADVVSTTDAPILTTEELIKRMRMMDYIVTCRFHGAIFAHLLRIPFLAISHHPKLTTLMSDLGLSNYCLDIRRFDAALLMDRFANLVSNRERIKTLLTAKASQYKAQLQAQLDQLFPMEVSR